MTLHSELEDLCGVLKHVPDSVDPERVRSLARRAQSALEVLRHIRQPDDLRIERDDELYGYRVTLTFTVDDIEDLLRQLYDVDV